MNDIALELARLHVFQGADYNSRLMAVQIKSYFNVYQDALEVLVYKGRKPSP